MRFAIPDDIPPVYRDRPETLEPLRRRGEVLVFSTPAADSVELLARLRGAQAVLNVRAATRFDAALLEALPELRIISRQGSGTDNVDLEVATRRGILVTTTPAAQAVSVA